MDDNEQREHDLPLAYARKFIDTMLERLTDDDLVEIWESIDPYRRLSRFGKAESITLVAYIMAHATTMVSRRDIAEIFQQE